VYVRPCTKYPTYGIKTCVAKQGDTHFKSFSISNYTVKEALQKNPYSRMGYRFRLGNNCGVDDQLDGVTSVSGRSRCSKRDNKLANSKFAIRYSKKRLGRSHFVPSVFWLCCIRFREIFPTGWHMRGGEYALWICRYKQPTACVCKVRLRCLNIPLPIFYNFVEKFP
ncbi:hypothetical protein BpHYR1_036478, partial [Brachionus plicatilis]